jgi:hypothetical protein
MPIMNDYKRMPLIGSGEWKGGEPETCTWTQGMFHNMYKTKCGHSHYFENGTATDYGFVYCPFCGKPIKDIPYSGKD